MTTLLRRGEDNDRKLMHITIPIALNQINTYTNNKYHKITSNNISFRVHSTSFTSMFHVLYKRFVFHCRTELKNMEFANNPNSKTKGLIVKARSTM